MPLTHQHAPHFWLCRLIWTWISPCTHHGLKTVRAVLPTRQVVGHMSFLCVFGWGGGVYTCRSHFFFSLALAVCLQVICTLTKAELPRKKSSIERHLAGQTFRSMKEASRQQKLKMKGIPTPKGTFSFIYLCKGYLEMARGGPSKARVVVRWRHQPSFFVFGCVLF